MSIESYTKETGTGLNDLPDEMLVDICWKLDIPTLIRTSRTSSRIRQICSEILEDREDEVKYLKSVKFIKDKLRTGKLSAMKMINQQNYVSIDISKINDLYLLVQYFDEVERQNRGRYPWPLTSVSYTLNYSHQNVEKRSSSFQMSPSIEDQLAEYLVNNQYRIHQ